MFNPTALVIRGALALAEPLQPYLVIGMVGVPLGIAVINAVTASLVREEVRSGQLVSHWLSQGSPAHTLRSLLTLARVFGLGLLAAPLLTLTSKFILVSALGFGVMCSLFLGSFPVSLS